MAQTPRIPQFSEMEVSPFFRVYGFQGLGCLRFNVFKVWAI